MSATRMPVRTAPPAGAGYEVVVGNDVLGEVPALLADAQRIAVCHPEPLAHLADRVVQLLEGHEVLRLVLPDGEAAKTGAVAQDAWERLGAAGFTRSDVVVTVGGGATTDMGGFVAATWLRGVRVVHVPTTLLGMVDAAVGGKTGMNTGAGKNLVGSFHEPHGVVCDLDLLTSLPQPELVAGLGEVVKCGFIADPRILELVEQRPAAALQTGSEELRELVERAIAVKIDVVVGDLRETGVSTSSTSGTGSTSGTSPSSGGIGREVLNYGHTLAHAVERATDYRVRHGEAVALGMVYVAELALLAGVLDEDTAARHASTLGLVGLPTRFADVGVDASFDELLATMRVDKKARGNQLRFVVLHGLALPAVLAGPAEEHLRAAYDVLKAGAP